MLIVVAAKLNQKEASGRAGSVGGVFDGVAGIFSAFFDSVAGVFSAFFNCIHSVIGVAAFFSRATSQKGNGTKSEQ